MVSVPTTRPLAGQQLVDMTATRSNDWQTRCSTSEWWWPHFHNRVAVTYAPPSTHLQSHSRPRTHTHPTNAAGHQRSCSHLSSRALADSLSWSVQCTPANLSYCSVTAAATNRLAPACIAWTTHSNTSSPTTCITKLPQQLHPVSSCTLRPAPPTCPPLLRSTAAASSI